MSPIADTLPPEFWEIIRKLDGAARTLGLPVPPLEQALRDLAMFDCDHVRQVGRSAWGIGGEYPGRPGEVATDVPDTILVVTTKVGERWDGAAWRAFDKAMKDVGDLIGKLAEPAQQLGQTLVKAADDMELSWDEAVGWVLTVAGIVITLATWETGIGAVIGLVVTIIGVIIDLIASVAPRVMAVNDLLTTMNEDMRKKIPSIPDVPISTPRTGDWDARTADPDN